MKNLAEKEGSGVKTNSQANKYFFPAKRMPMEIVLLHSNKHY
jgi:hypothetical protein